MSGQEERTIQGGHWQVETESRTRRALPNEIASLPQLVSPAGAKPVGYRRKKKINKNNPKRRIKQGNEILLAMLRLYQEFWLTANCTLHLKTDLTLYFSHKTASHIDNIILMGVRKALYAHISFRIRLPNLPQISVCKLCKERQEYRLQIWIHTSDN